MNPLLRTLTILLAFSFIAGGLFCHAAPPLPDGDALLDRSLAQLDHARTIQAVIRVTNSNGRPGSAVILRYQGENAPDGTAVRGRMTTTPVGAAPDTAHGLSPQISLNDGRDGYVMDPARKTYEKERLGADRFTGLFRSGLVKLRRQGITLTTSRTVWHGRPSYLLQGSQGGYGLRAVVAQDTSALEEFRGSGRNGTYSDMVVTSLRLNAPLPAGVFQKPGADYREERQP